MNEVNMNQVNMNQIPNQMPNQPELRGLGGWMVLFQIYIIMALVGSINSLITTLVVQQNMIIPSFVPYYIALLAAAFIASLVSMILFYCKRIAFRPMFVVYSAVALTTGVITAVYAIDYSYLSVQTGAFGVYLESFMRAISCVSIVIGAGIMIAMIIALYRSKRVKNTFINN